MTDLLPFLKEVRLFLLREGIREVSDPVRARMLKELWERAMMIEEELGRVASPNRLSSDDGAPAGLHPPGFDPARKFAPCPTCSQYSHSIGEDQLAAAFNHFQSMYAHPVRGHPMGHNFDEATRDAAQVLMTAAKAPHST